MLQKALVVYKQVVGNSHTITTTACNSIGAILQDMDENRTMRHSNTSEEHLQFTVKHLTRGRVMITLEWSSTTKMILKERC